MRFLLFSTSFLAAIGLGTARPGNRRRHLHPRNDASTETAPYPYTSTATASGQATSTGVYPTSPLRHSPTPTSASASSSTDTCTETSPSSPTGTSANWPGWGPPPYDHSPTWGTNSPTWGNEPPYGPSPTWGQSPPPYGQSSPTWGPSPPPGPWTSTGSPSQPVGPTSTGIAPYPTTWPSSPYPTTPYPSPSSTAGHCGYWLADIKHQGIAAFNPDPATYTVFRNVHDFGAKGDGKADDTAAINKAISSGGRCGPGTCNSTSVTPAVVYFPPGTYLISSSIIDYYYTQLIGNPNCLPTLRASPNFTVTADQYMIDGDPYNKAGVLEFGATNIFWRQIRNFILDMTHVSPSKGMSGIHWPTGQATSIMNVIFQMSAASGTNQTGIVIDSGSGGFLNDLVFNGGKYGGNFGNQQFTMRNLTFNNVKTAIYQDYSWGWVYNGITINNSTVGVNMYNGGTKAGAVGSITFFDSEINNTPVGFYTARTNNSQPPSSSSLILENVQLNNVPVAVRGGDNTTTLAGSTGSLLIPAWGQGHEFLPYGPTNFQGFITPVERPSSLTQSDGSYYVQSKPQYQQYPVSSFISARDEGATGNGHTDDTAALQKAILTAVQQQKILFVDQGDYLVSNTIYIPAGSKIVGETYSVILSSGEFFNDLSNPQPVVQMGKPGEQGAIEWSDMIVSTLGQQRGAILFEYNLIAPSTAPAGMWDVHSRVGGFTGSDLQVAQCPTTPNKTVTAANLDYNCIGAFLTMHVTSTSAGLYMENNWLWTADHDVDSADETQITIYNGRGLLIESTDGPVWLWSSAVEHHTLYQYSFVNASNVYAGFIQTETPYYQPNPAAPLPWPYNPVYADPTFPAKTIHSANYTVPNADAWGLRILNSQSINIYASGFYSFFDDYSTTCSTPGVDTCQSRIFEYDSDSSATLYNLNTVGTRYMITYDGKDTAYFKPNNNNFFDTIALFRDS